LLAARLERLASLRTSSASVSRFEALALPTLADEPTHMPLLLELLAYWRAAAAPENVTGEEAIAKWRAEKVLIATGRIYAAVDAPKLAQYYVSITDTKILFVAKRSP